MRDLIFRRGRARLARPPRGPAGHGERGAVGVLVAVLIGAGVLIGMGALVVDVGQLYQNRAELQNGADAAALAVAKSCIEGTCAPSVAAQYADANASSLTGGKASVDLVCGSGSLGACPASTGQITDCPAAPEGASYVDVHTSTELPNGSHLLPPVFARTLAGNGSYQGSTVHACAQAQWGPPATASTIAMTFSACTWDAATSTGTVFAPSPPYPPSPSPSLDQVIELHAGNTRETNLGCPTEPAGADAPGNFGWTDDSGDCSVTITGTTYGGNTGNNVSQDCRTAIYNDWASRSAVYIPVYVSVSGTGANASYTLKGFAAFVISGYHMPGFKQRDWLTGQYPCSGDAFCVSGVFTQGLIPSGGGTGGTNLGAYIVRLTG